MKWVLETTMIPHFGMKYMRKQFLFHLTCSNINFIYMILRHFWKSDEFYHHARQSYELVISRQTFFLRLWSFSWTFPQKSPKCACEFFIVILLLKPRFMLKGALAKIAKCIPENAFTIWCHAAAGFLFVLNVKGIG